jgi:hypothetical protein
MKGTPQKAFHRFMHREGLRMTSSLGLGSNPEVLPCVRFLFSELKPECRPRPGRQFILINSFLHACFWIASLKSSFFYKLILIIRKWM